MDIKRNMRKWGALIGAIILYFVVHEGAHFLYAAGIGAFRQINFMGFGVQVDIFRERVSDFQLGIFCLVGPVSAILFGYILVLLARPMVKTQSLLLRAVLYYASLVLLMVDPLYLSVIYSFVGGGDMNGIALILPETTTRVVFGVIAVINMVIIFKYILPIYKKANLMEKRRQSQNN